jgi:hypothetical protein
MTISKAIKIILVPATQLIRYLTKAYTVGSSFDFSQALKTPTPFPFLVSGMKIKHKKN